MEEITVPTISIDNIWSEIYVSFVPMQAKIMIKPDINRPTPRLFLSTKKDKPFLTLFIFKNNRVSDTCNKARIIPMMIFVLSTFIIIPIIPVRNTLIALIQYEIPIEIIDIGKETCNVDLLIRMSKVHSTNMKNSFERYSLYSKETLINDDIKNDVNPKIISFNFE